MSLLKKILDFFNLSKQEKTALPSEEKKTVLPSEEKKTGIPSEENMPKYFKWIKPENNSFGIYLLDVSEFTDQMVLYSPDINASSNVRAMSTSIGTEFINADIQEDDIATDFVIPTEGELRSGILYKPNSMEDKWAIYYYGKEIIIAGTWMAMVYVKAEVVQEKNQIRVKKLIGSFYNPDEPRHFTLMMFKYLLLRLVMNKDLPAPLPKHFFETNDYNKIQSFIEMLYANKAKLIHFEDDFVYNFESSLPTTHPILHVAALSLDMLKFSECFENFYYNLNTFSEDGLSLLQNVLFSERDREAKLSFLIKKGIDVNFLAKDGADALSTAIHRNDINCVKMLLDAGININYRHPQEFTPLSVAIQFNNNIEIVRLLLEHGADKNVTFKGQKLADLASQNNLHEIAKLLQ